MNYPELFKLKQKLIEKQDTGRTRTFSGIAELE